MIKQIMLDEITENAVCFRDEITIKITQNFPIPVIDKCRIVKAGSRLNIDNSQYDILENYRTIVNGLFTNYQNYVRYRKHNNNYIIKNF